MLTERLSRRQFLHSVGAATVAATVAGQVTTASQTVQAAPTPGALRFGVQIVPQHATYADILQTWREADDLGFDTAFLFDHFVPIMSDPNGPCFEGWTLLAALAAQSKRIKLGLLVTGNTYRNPALLAKMAATVDHISNGRVILGLGAAWFEAEHTAYGIPFYTPGERAKRLGEAVEVIKLLFSQQKSTFNGKYYQLKDALCEPKPVQKPHPPLLIGGVGPKLIQPLAARHADIWHFFPSGGGDDVVKKMCADFDAICQKVGRDPAQVEKSLSLRDPQLVGTAEEIQGRVKALAAVGVRHFILSLT
ncbi:MAG: LLM class F420-dependent oxidoreductase, partial [Deltaproteobacteria bacterium]|nr:LLM class F420-dependent oxidoreductase [Deltaproteobacteria bacterium]